jgi:hypothetical protein
VDWFIPFAGELKLNLGVWGGTWSHVVLFHQAS